jgi:hypothetical protein
MDFFIVDLRFETHKYRLHQSQFLLFGVANRHARLRCRLLLFAARRLILSAAQARPILHLHFVCAFLACRVAERTVRSCEKTHRAEQSCEHFHLLTPLLRKWSDGYLCINADITVRTAYRYPARAA